MSSIVEVHGRVCATVSRPLRAMCAVSRRASGCCRYARAEILLVVCGAPRAAVVLASEVARRAIAHRSALRPTGRPADGRDGPGCHVRYADPLVMYGLPRVPHGTHSP